MNAVKLLAVFSENKLGQLERVTKTLAEARINIQWITIATTETFGVVKLLVDQSDLAYRLLKQNGLAVSQIEVLAIEAQDKPGGLHMVSEALTRNRINVQNASGYVSNNRAVLLIEVQDIEQARSVARKENLRLLTAEETLRL